MTQRHLLRRVRGIDTADGAGVKLKRVIGQPALDMLDPFLMLDEFRSDQASDYIEGFPEHPHRGFETVTYMLAGRMRHQDNHGNQGDLGPGSVQWMTAGRGLLHSEMPQQEEGLMWGFQLWVNLPADNKMAEPRYQDIPASEIPEVAPAPGVTARVIAGELAGVTGPVAGIATAPLYLDLSLAPHATFDLPLPVGHAGFAYVFDGAPVHVAGQALGRGDLGEFSRAGDTVSLRAGDAATRVIVVAGRPLGEPVARYGPFVMNTPAQIHEAIADFRAGKF
ncbi:pirin family protein [Luteibacter sp. PPL201]|uniref:Pirin family protein n=1 Tax=Luteibacter sahnii TaxID=3021977 RepID=A0ABT6BFC2_9GAMM